MTDEEYAIVVKSAYYQVWPTRNFIWLFWVCVTVIGLFILIPAIKHKCKKYLISLNGVHDYQLIKESSFYQVWIMRHFLQFFLCCLTIVGIFIITYYMIHQYKKINGGNLIKLNV
jgi:hypothetical protein